MAVFFPPLSAAGVFLLLGCEHKGLFSHALDSIGIAQAGIGCALHMIISACLCGFFPPLIHGCMY